ncbi:MAG TPA: neprosin family prolyl endopeptidase [Acidimicrobiia bacterium]|nr:neprosin family prolyl endopeptidase [Acidimicrobiia bacterium]
MGPQAFASSSRPTARRAFTTFDEFRAELGHATYAPAAPRGRVVASATAFAQMRTYLQALYRGVDVRRSFVTDGSYFDCVTIASQPSARGRAIAPTPAPMPGASTAHSKLWTTEGTDARGAVVSCAAGTVPMQRTTLDQMARYTSVRAFLSRGKAPRAAVDASTYRYAHAFQLVKNFGALSTISVWNPKLPPAVGGDDHSLSQQWVTGGSGSNLQTAEAGWTKDLGFSPKKPILFVYFTADGYNHTGCYNLTCGAFVQTDNSVGIGAPVKPCCSTPTVDDHFAQYWFLTGGRWWLNINDTYIGYFPTSVYNGGQMSKNATEVDFGGEVNASVTSAPWPAMGSGKFAKAGVHKAAYQSGIEYITPKGQYHATALTPSATSTCYTIKYTRAAGATPSFFYYGGPGGAEGVC